MKRQVTPVESYKDAVLTQVRDLSAECAADLFFFVELLQAEDPDVSDDCGELDRAFSVYACSLPNCPAWRLVVTISSRDRQADCLVHGLVRAGEGHCTAAYTLAAQQLKLQHKPWDPRK